VNGKNIATYHQDFLSKVRSHLKNYGELNSVGTISSADEKDT